MIVVTNPELCSYKLLWKGACLSEKGWEPWKRRVYGWEKEGRMLVKARRWMSSRRVAAERRKNGYEVILSHGKREKRRRNAYHTNGWNQQTANTIQTISVPLIFWRYWLYFSNNGAFYPFLPYMEKKIYLEQKLVFRSLFLKIGKKNKGKNKNVKLGKDTFPYFPFS